MWSLKAKDRQDRAEMVNRCVVKRRKLAENANSEIFRGFWLVTMIGLLIVCRKVVNVDYTGTQKATRILWVELIMRPSFLRSSS